MDTRHNKTKLKYQYQKNQIMYQIWIGLGTGIGKRVTYKNKTTFYFATSNKEWITNGTSITPEELFEHLFGPGTRERY